MFLNPPNLPEPYSPQSIVPQEPEYKANIYDTPSIYDDDESMEMMKDLDSFDAVPKEMMPDMENDPTQRTYTVGDYEYDDESSDSNGFFSNIPDFKSGIMTPDFWEMFDSNWGQKVQ